MSQIKTMVYLDIEATGLKSAGRPRITELSLVAVSTESILELHSKLTSQNQNIKNEQPRVMNKLTVCIYPMAPIRPEVSALTGLDNYNLSGQSTFELKTGVLINSFLASLPSPICLVAHNGNLYDFPLLKAEMKKAGIDLLYETLCADSYVGIKEIFKNRGKVQNDKIENALKPTKSSGSNDINEVIQSEEKITKQKKEYAETETDCLTTPLKAFSRIGFKRQNCNSMNKPKVPMKVCKVEIGVTPSSNKKILHDPKWRTKMQNINTIRSKRKLDFNLSGSPTSYSLINLHRQLLGSSPMESHGAEVDCLALIRTTSILGVEWIDWVQRNCYLFKNCTRMLTFQT